MKHYYCAECVLATIAIDAKPHVIRALGFNEHLLTRCEKCNDISIFELSNNN